MARLHYANCDQPGISRKKLALGWAYFDATGQRIVDRDEIDRLNAIALPPAYEQAWFSPSPDAHILATGIDARRRKQYRYHPQFRTRKDAEKYRNCRAFGEKLPQLRKRVAKDLRGRTPTADRAIAAVVRLGDDFTAKHFRTWGASVAAFEAMAEAEPGAPLPPGAMIEQVAQRLGNTPAIARKSYIHPLMLDIAQNRQVRWRQRLKLPRATQWLSAMERGLLRELGKG